MDEVKTCSKCSKKLRADNTKGVCSEAAACRKRVAGGDDAVLERVGVAEPPPKGDALKRFRVVAEAMGYAPDRLLAQYCEGWLAALREEIDKLEGRPADE